MVGLGVLEVDFLMRHIEVAAVEHWLLCVELSQELAQIPFPPEAEVQTFQTVLCIGSVAVHEEEGVVLERHDSTFVAGKHFRV